MTRIDVCSALTTSTWKKPYGWHKLEMPTVLRQDGFDVMIYTDDHPPAHVHVFKAGGAVIINLGDPATRPSVRKNIRMSGQDERKALIIVGDQQQMLLARWREIHG